MKTVKHCRACKVSDMLEIEYAQDLTVKGVDLNVAGLHAWECPECQARVETAAQIDFNAGLVRTEFLHQHAKLG